jgi:hypothetical protein
MHAHDEFQMKMKTRKHVTKQENKKTRKQEIKHTHAPSHIAHWHFESLLFAVCYLLLGLCYLLSLLIINY